MIYFILRILSCICILGLGSASPAYSEIRIDDSIANNNIPEVLSQYPACLKMENYLGGSGWCKKPTELVKDNLTKQEFMDCRDRMGLEWFAPLNECRVHCETLLVSHPELGQFCGEWIAYEYLSPWASVSDPGPYPMPPYAPIGATELRDLKKISVALGLFEVDALEFEHVLIPDFAKLSQVERISVVNSEISEFVRSWNFFSAIQGAPEVSIDEFQRLTDQSNDLLNVLEHQYGLVSSLSFQPPKRVVGIGTYDAWLQDYEATIAKGSYSDITAARISTANEERLRKHFFVYPNVLLSEETGEFDFLGDAVCDEPDNFSPFFGNAVDAFAWFGMVERLRSNFHFEGNVAKLWFKGGENRNLQLVSLRVNDVTVKDGLNTCNRRIVERYVEHKPLGEAEWTEELRDSTVKILRDTIQVVRRISNHSRRILSDLEGRRYAKIFEKRRSEIEQLAIPARSEVQFEVSRLTLKFDSLESSMREIEAEIDRIQSEIDIEQFLELEGFRSLEKNELVAEGAVSELEEISKRRLKLKIREMDLLSEIENLSSQDASGNLVLEKLEEYGAIQSRLFALDQMWKNIKLQLVTSQQNSMQVQETIEASIDKRALLSIYLQSATSELESVLPDFSATSEELSKYRGMLADLSRHLHIQF